MEFLRLEIDRPALPVIAGVVHFDGKSGAGGHVNGKGGGGKGREMISTQWQRCIGRLCSKENQDESGIPSMGFRASLTSEELPGAADRWRRGTVGGARPGLIVVIFPKQFHVGGALLEGPPSAGR